MKKIRIIPVLLIALLAFAACSNPAGDGGGSGGGGGGGGSGGGGTPTLTGTVSINGSAEVGETLTANTNSLGGSGTISYQWKRGNTTDIGTDDDTYQVQTSDIGEAITVTVTRSGYSGSITSAPTADVTDPGLPALTGTVSINGTGTVKVGQTLTANTNSLGGNGTISYQWKRETTVIGFNYSSYTVQSADTSSTITVTVTRSGNSGRITSAPVTVESGLLFTLISNNTAYSVSKGTSGAAEVVIPSTYEGKPVTQIAANGFSSYTNLTSITIPASVTSIGYNAFNGCTGLTSITIPFVGNTLNGTTNTHFG